MATQLYATSGLPRLKRNQTMEMNARLAYLPQMLAQKSQNEYQNASIADMQARQKLAEEQFGIETGKFNLAQQEYGLSERNTALAEKNYGLQERGTVLKEQELGLQEKGLGLQEQQAEQARREFGWQQNQADKAAALRKESEQKQMGVQGAGLGFNILGGSGSSTIGSLTDKAGGLWSGLFGEKSATPTSARTGGLWDTNLAAMGGGAVVGAGAGQIFGGTSKLKKSAIGLGVGGLAGFLGGGGDWGAGLGAGLLGGLGGLVF